MEANQRSDLESNRVRFGPGSRAAYIARNYREIIVRPDSVVDAAPAAGPSPFKGLLPFTPADAPLFFGREAITQKLAGRLHDSHFLALVGAAGSGKTSLIAAGLTPALRRREWLVHTFTPSAHPLHELARTLRVADPALAREEELVPTLVVNPRALPLAANRLVAKRGAPRLLLVVDQFEELFTLCEDPAERRAFLETLMAAAAEQGPTTVLISVHAGFYDHCLQHKGLRTVLARAQEPLAPLTGANLLRAIAEPARSGGWHFVEGLLEQFLEQAGSDPGRLPLISQALFETWKRRQGTTMTFAGYRAAGGIEDAIAQSAEQALRGVPSGQVELVKNMFVVLADLGEGVPDTRRSVPITELTRLGQASEVASVLARLMRARLLSAEGGHVQLAHESLISHWPRLREWLAGEQERVRFEQRLLHDAQTWAALGRDARALYQGARLRHAQAWRVESPVENALPALARAFLDASEEHARREAREEETRALQAQLSEEAAAPPAGEQPSMPPPASFSYRQFGLMAVLAILAVALVLAGTAALYITRAAEAEARAAQAQALAARSTNALPQEPLTALSLAWQAVDQTYAVDGTITEEAQAALGRALAVPVPVTVLRAHQAPITGAIFNPGGDRLLTISLDGSGRLWDLEGDQLARLQGDARGLIDAGFDNSGERLFTLGQDGIVRLWDLQGRELARIGGQRVTVVAFHPAGDRLLTGTQDGSLRLWDLQGNEIAALPDQPSPISVVRFHPDGNQILTASQTSARLWDLQGVPLAHLEGHTSGITDAAFSPDGQRVVTASYDHSARIWDLAGNEVAHLQGHDDVVWSAAFNPAGDRLVTAGGDNVARVWDLEGNLLALLGAHESGITMARFHPAGERIVTVSWSGRARFWDEQGKELARLEEAGREVNVAGFDPAGVRLVTADLEGGVRIWEMGTAGLVTGEEEGVARARLAGDDALASDSALWTAGRARLIRSAACPDLFDAATCAGQ